MLIYFLYKQLNLNLKIFNQSLNACRKQFQIVISHSLSPLTGAASWRMDPNCHLAACSVRISKIIDFAIQNIICVVSKEF